MSSINAFFENSSISDFFENENDRQMYELLFTLRNGSQEDLRQLLDSHPIPEGFKSKRDSSKSREERTEELVNDLMQMESYLNKKYALQI